MRTHKMLYAHTIQGSNRTQQPTAREAGPPCPSAPRPSSPRSSAAALRFAAAAAAAAIPAPSPPALLAPADAAGGGGGGGGAVRAPVRPWRNYSMHACAYTFNRARVCNTGDGAASGVPAAIACGGGGGGGWGAAAAGGAVVWGGGAEGGMARPALVMRVMRYSLRSSSVLSGFSRWSARTYTHVCVCVCVCVCVFVCPAVWTAKNYNL